MIDEMYEVNSLEFLSNKKEWVLSIPLNQKT